MNIRSRVSRFKRQFWIVLGLELILIALGLRGFLWFILPTVTLTWYCWQMETFYGAICSKGGAGLTIAMLGTLAAEVFIIRSWLIFAREWRLYLKPINE